MDAENNRDKALQASERFGPDSFNFDAWRALYEQDPEAFEQERAKMIENTISAAPEQHQRRLRGLMFQIEAKRQAAKSPMDACVQISNMMWDQFEQLRLHLNAIASPEQLSEDELKRLQKPKEAARVLPLHQAKSR